MALVVYHLSWVDKRPAAKCDFRYVSYWRGNVSSLYFNFLGHKSSNLDACQKRWLLFLASGRSWKNFPAGVKKVAIKTGTTARAGSEAVATLRICDGLDNCCQTEDLDNPGDDRVSGQTDVYENSLLSTCRQVQETGGKIITVSRLGLTQLQIGLLNLNWRKTSMVWLTAGSWSGCR